MFIHVPSNKFIEADDAAEHALGVEGWFTLQARNRAGRLLREHSFKADREVGPFHNLILNQGMDRLGTSTGAATYSNCLVGVGTLAPAVTQVSLSNFVANVQSSVPAQASGNAGAPTYYSWRRFTWTSSIGGIPASNLTEIGVGSSSTNNGNLFSRELIRDANGVPVAFPIALDEQLTVTYELRVYPPLTDTEADISISGVSHSTITRAAVITSNLWQPALANGSATNFITGSVSNQTLYSGELPDLLSSSTPVGNLGNSSSVSSTVYVPGSYTRDILATWSISTGNGEARTVRRACGCGGFNVRYDPPIVKTNEQTLMLPQRIIWARS